MQNIGTLVSSSIRPNSSLDPIASAYAVEIKGGLHTAATLSDRNLIIFERREWGMMCYVESEDLTYQLRYNYVNTNIMNNNNWVIFSGSGGGGGTEWLDSVLSVSYNEPLSPNNGDRYLVGLAPGDSITGANWSLVSPGLVLEWNSVTNAWDQTVPTDGMSVRVDNEDNAIYKYEGVYPSGVWGKEKLNQVRSLDATSSDAGFTYVAQSFPTFEAYYENMIFLVDFSIGNSLGTASLNINSLGSVNIIKVSSNGLLPLVPNDIIPGVIYTLLYDGVDFQLTKPSNESLFNVKYYVEPTDYIVVPQNHQYWVYGDLTIDGGFILNQGQVIIANGNLNLINSGGIQNVGVFPNGQLLFANFAGGITPSFVDSDTIQFTQSNSPGLVVSADVIDGSLTASKLNTNGEGATAGYILSVNSDGTFRWIESTAVVGATNGLTEYSGEIGLGGELIVDTLIEGNGNEFIIEDLSNFEVDSSTMSLISSDFNLIVDSAILNVSNGQGLQYATDYSSSFTTYSLVDKNYVDNLISQTGKLSYSDKNFIVSSTISGNGQFTGLTVSGVPLVDSYVQLFVNGLEYEVDGLGSAFYFSDDGGSTAKTSIEQGDSLYYNESFGFGSIEVGFILRLNYLE
jgi:hypothetical protein